jgi:hypothetical protein
MMQKKPKFQGIECQKTSSSRYASLKMPQFFAACPNFFASCVAIFGHQTHALSHKTVECDHPTVRHFLSPPASCDRPPPSALSHLPTATDPAGPFHYQTQPPPILPFPHVFVGRFMPAPWDVRVKNSTGLRGVRLQLPGRYVVEITTDGQRWWLRTFESPELAARSYDAVAW